MPEERLAEPLEAAAYFVVAESLTNAVKHAEASEVRVRMATEAGELRVEIADDGRGGADPASGGTGLRGLADRVEALGGRLALESPPGAGTTVRACPSARADVTLAALPDRGLGVTDFDALYAAHRDDVWRYFRRRASRRPRGPRHRGVPRGLAPPRGVPREPLPWLYGVARKVLANHRRGGDRRDALTERAAAHAADGRARPRRGRRPARPTSPARSPRCSDHDRELVLLVAWEGLTLAEAAAALGCRRGTAAVRLHRARRRLHTALNDESGPALASMTALEER